MSTECAKGRRAIARRLVAEGDKQVEAVDSINASKEKTAPLTTSSLRGF